MLNVPKVSRHQPSEGGRHSYPREEETSSQKETVGILSSFSMISLIFPPSFPPSLLHTSLNIHVSILPCFPGNSFLEKSVFSLTKRLKLAHCLPVTESRGSAQFSHRVISLAQELNNQCLPKGEFLSILRFFLSMYWCYACIYVCVLCVQCSWGPERRSDALELGRKHQELTHSV